MAPPDLALKRPWNQNAVKAMKDVADMVVRTLGAARGNVSLARERMEIACQLYAELRGRFRHGHGVSLGLIEVVLSSFNNDGLIISAELKRSRVSERLELTCKLYRDLMDPLSYGYNRRLAMDDLPRRLRCELDGIPYMPASKEAWSVDVLRTLPGTDIKL
jgi:hypothetical protein